MNNNLAVHLLNSHIGSGGQSPGDFNKLVTGATTQQLYSPPAAHNQVSDATKGLRNLVMAHSSTDNQSLHQALSQRHGGEQ